MIDIHCHFLPGIDDGPDTMDEAMELAAMAVANGIRHSVLTPHIHPGRYTNQKSTLLPVFEEFKAALRSRNIQLQVSLGGEVRLSIESIQLILSDQVPMLGTNLDFAVMLLEFPHSHIVPGSEKLVDHLLNKKIRPIIAHPERNKDVMRSLHKITPFVERGCMLQVTAGSVAGRFGKEAQQRAIEMLERDWVTVLATDAHNVKYRPPDLAEGKKAAARIVGEDMAEALVSDRPGAIINQA